MGYSHILWINDEGLKNIDPNDAEIVKELGDAVLYVCWERDFKQGEITGRVASHSTKVKSADRVLSTSDKLYLWSKNCISPLESLDEESLKLAAELIEREIRSRRKNKK